MNETYDVIIIGSGPAGLGAAFQLAENSGKSVLLLEKTKISSGGLRNDCKQNYTYPVGFSTEHWSEDEADELLEKVAEHLNPDYVQQRNLGIYVKRAENLGVTLLNIKQAHVGTDKAKGLIANLIAQLRDKGVTVELETEMSDIDYPNKTLILADGIKVKFNDLILAPGRAGYTWLQKIMAVLDINYSDNIVDVGVRIEAKEEYYPIVKDYYDPKFIFPGRVRTFCTNSGSAYIVKEKYEKYYSVNGHAYSTDKEPNGLVNFAMLKTITLTDPVVSGHQFAEILGQMAMQLSGGQPMMQRIGDFRLGKRSKKETFNDDLYSFKPTLVNATPGDLSLAVPSKILRDIWRSMKLLDTIIPGILHPSTIIYYPEIKTYAIRPDFIDQYFKVKENIYMIGDGAGTSRGITGAWASGIRAAKGILLN
ncbi:MAG: pyridine nucleotide-disulfide oxidoreductase [Spirochaetae bacterium HGW-Spirochaetae-5]|nr:MAG: pyridine nucleotide-disulfide oxidoreductase [Spirochaetae bacterium HGW-Spirochaetae-5]